MILVNKWHLFLISKPKNLEQPESMFVVFFRKEIGVFENRVIDVMIEKLCIIINGEFNQVLINFGNE